MVSIKFEGKKPTLSAMEEMSEMMKGIRKYGNKYTKNRYFIYQGSVMKAGQSTKAGANKFMNKERTLFTIYNK